MENSSLQTPTAFLEEKRSVNILEVIFDTTLASKDLPLFRKAIVKAIGFKYDWFHNHDNQQDSAKPLYYRYPLIQYKRQGNLPKLVCIDLGIEEGQLFFQKQKWNLNFKGDRREVEIDEARFRKYPLGFVAEGEPWYWYRIRDWQALNQHNYREYQSKEGLMEIIRFLEPKLIANILSFAKGIGWRIEPEVKLEIMEMYPSTMAEYKGFKPVLFNFSFATNVLLPNRIGLGKGAALGFGTIQKIRNREYRAE